MMKVIFMPVEVCFCDLCGVAIGLKYGDTIIYEPNDPRARVEACVDCARKRGYIK